MYSRTIIIGRLTKDVELKHSQAGNAIGLMSVAVDKRRKEDGADFYNVVMFKQQAENAAKYLSKGRLVMVEGSMSSRQYENSQGQNVRVWELIADNVKYLERGERNDPFKDDGQMGTVDDSGLPF